MENTIEVGDVVALKSGSPKMTVYKINEQQEATVVYSPYGTNTIISDVRIPLVALKKLATKCRSFC